MAMHSYYGKLANKNAATHYYLELLNNQYNTQINGWYVAITNRNTKTLFSWMKITVHLIFCNATYKLAITTI